jgi:hypothetical protein
MLRPQPDRGRPRFGRGLLHPGERGILDRYLFTVARPALKISSSPIDSRILERDTRSFDGRCATLHWSHGCQIVHRAIAA